MIWRSRRGWVLRVQDEYVVVNVLGIALETYAPARLVFGERTYFVDHYVEDGQLVARTAVDVRWGKLHEMSILEEGLVADLTQATRRHLRALQTKSVLLRLALDDLDERNLPDQPASEFLRAASAQLASAPPELTLWSSRRGTVVRAGEQYYVLDHERRLLEVHAPDQFAEAGRTYFVDHYVKGGELVRRTAIDQRWGEWSEKLVIELDLHEVIATDGSLGFSHSPARPTEDSFTRTDVRPDEPDLVWRMREAEGELASPEEPARPPVQPLPPEVKRAMECLRENDDNALCKAMLWALRALSNEGSTYAMTALARASLLYLKESDVPAIDETWEPVQSPLAWRIAKLVDDLDARNAREAADAMETCAALLGYRDGFPVLRS